jgi:hypothetical protein
MSKKPNRRPPVKQADDLTEEGLMTAMTEMRNETIAAKPAPSLTSVLLKDVRAAALKMSADTAHNIAELESWRNEIDATIAFLKAQRK